MARNRFREILRFLRFDMRSIRSIRLQADKFALVSDLWNRFVDNCISSYKPGPNIAIDQGWGTFYAEMAIFEIMVNHMAASAPV